MVETMEKLEDIIIYLSLLLVFVMISEVIKRRRKKRKERREKRGGSGLGFLSYPSPLNDFGLWL